MKRNVPACDLRNGDTILLKNGHETVVVIDAFTDLDKSKREKCISLKVRHSNGYEGRRWCYRDETFVQIIHPKRTERDIVKG